jgi:tRNA pseudouridine13 synthase
MTSLHVPPLLTEDLPAVGGRIGPELEHFVVEELPLYEASGEGDHWYAFIEKRGLTTQDLIFAVARASGARASDIGSAGMKDKQGVTRQWISVPASAPEPSAWQLPESLRVVAQSRHRNKLRTGHLRANRFRITLVDVPSDGLAHADSIVQRLRAQGLPNYFGPQRFGRQGRSFEQALAWVGQGQDAGGPGVAADSRGKKRGPKARFEHKLLPSVLQSDVFNRYLTARLARPEPLLTGEVVRLEGSPKVFTVEDPEKELPRLQQGDIHLTGPMVGPRTVHAAAEAGLMENAALAELGLSEAELERLASAAPGTRRDLRVPLPEIEVEAGGPGELVLSFVLPAGSFATQLLRELTRTPWLEPR